MTATLLFAALLAASSVAEEQASLPDLITADFDIAEQQEDDAERWLLPKISDGEHRPAPPRLRIRGRKVKLRIPFG